VVLQPTQKHSDNTSATYRKSTKLRNCKKQPYWALHTHTLSLSLSLSLSVESADVKVQSIFHGEITLHVAECKYRIAVSLCTLEIWVVSGM